jgi:hypothetical protein
MPDVVGSVKWPIFDAGPFVTYSTRPVSLSLHGALACTDGCIFGTTLDNGLLCMWDIRLSLRRPICENKSPEARCAAYAPLTSSFITRRVCTRTNGTAKTTSCLGVATVPSGTSSCG